MAKLDEVISMALTRKAVLAAFNDESEEQVPFSVWHHFNPNAHTVAKLDPTIFKNDVEKEHAYVKAVDSDFVKLMDDGYFTYDLQGVSDPNDPESLSKIEPISSDNEWLQEQYQLVTDQIAGIDSDRLVFTNVFSAVTVLKWELALTRPGKDTSVANQVFADLYTKHPEVVTNALKVINQDIIKQIKVGKQAGVDGVFFSTQEIQDDRIDQQFFNDVQKQLDLELIDVINANFEFGILHVCGHNGAENHLPWFTDYDLPVVNWATDIDGYSLSAGKELFHNKVVLGGLGSTAKDVLYSGSQEQIQAKVDQLIADAGTTGVIIGADCTLPADTPEDHIRWASEAAHSYLKRQGVK
ncbi:uroporphyrinogen decarboxylase family protein [Lactobacillus sp. Sy-1]|uniref:uroporphyrinogen decarboxylase family protein n=1 Tax=Lactobacillus sp. Sy-1 TaxID=2109645 RepID=UPI001C5B7FAA|nr:uroporphyrinogen decarboxylase family protein [Lactobacillus sp. Sy-1]MBW1606255.1 uroporphyrinogen decarboxylase [Lactobacillus sp. Sy-1]